MLNAKAVASLLGICMTMVDDYDDPWDRQDESPYCECDLEPNEEEYAAMTCACCGKEIYP